MAEWSRASDLMQEVVGSNPGLGNFFFLQKQITNPCTENREYLYRLKGNPFRDYREYLYGLQGNPCKYYRETPSRDYRETPVGYTGILLYRVCTGISCCMYMQVTGYNLITGIPCSDYREKINSAATP